MDVRNRPKNLLFVAWLKADKSYLQHAFFESTVILI